MFVNFFHELKSANLPVSLREYLTLLEAMDKGIPDRKIEDFYYLSRSTLVKDEKNLDKFDQVFGHVFKGLENLEAAVGGIADTEDAQKIIEERFGKIETSVQFLEKEIDNISIPDVTEIKTDIATIKADLETLDRDISKLETGNPLAG